MSEDTPVDKNKILVIGELTEDNTKEIMKQN